MMADVRLIDARVAQKIADKELTVSDAGTVQFVLSHTPTIDPESLRPVGRWHLNEDGKWACTYCDGLAVEHPDEPEKWQALTRYCPNCGARMKGEAK